MEKNPFTPLLPLTDWVIHELNKSSNVLRLFAVGWEWNENLSHSSYKKTLTHPSRFGVCISLRFGLSYTTEVEINTFTVGETSHTGNTMTLEALLKAGQLMSEHTCLPGRSYKNMQNKCTFLCFILGTLCQVQGLHSDQSVRFPVLLLLGCSWLLWVPGKSQRSELSSRPAWDQQDFSKAIRSFSFHLTQN